MTNSTELPTRHVAFFQKKGEQLINKILEQNQIKASVSKDIMTDVAQRFLRDIYRIDEQQRGDVSLAKFAGYWAFWIRKLKPVTNPIYQTETAGPTAVDSANEIVALQFALEVVTLLRSNDDLNDIVWRNCQSRISGKCDGASCIQKEGNQYLNFGDGVFQKYIVYSLRNRTFGPHHFALLLETLLFSACVDASSVGQG